MPARRADGVELRRRSGQEGRVARRVPEDAPARATGACRSARAGVSPTDAAYYRSRRDEHELEPHDGADERPDVQRVRRNHEWGRWQRHRGDAGHRRYGAG